MNLSLLSGVFALTIGLIYSAMAFLLPDASIGRPDEPKYFPMVLGMLMVTLSAMLIFEELKNKAQEKGTGKPFQLNSNLKKIGLTCLFSILYALLFNRIGYVLSTILFLQGELWLFNGWKKWKINTVVALVFSLFIYILFSKLLGVYLPMTPGIWI